MSPRPSQPLPRPQWLKGRLALVPSVAWGPLVCLASLLLFSIPALQPLLAAELTCGYDNVLHMWRAIETDALLQAGILYSRWQPHLALGLGHPLLLFNPPISPLLAALFHRTGLTWPAAVNATFVSGLLLSACTTWQLVREWWGDAPGVVAGAIITTLPFHAYVNFHRASMSEALAWAFPPLVLWGLIRWQKCGQRRGLLAAAGGLAGLLLTHDASAYLFLPLPLATIAALALAHRDWRVLVKGLAAFALGVGLAAFFWLPSVLERPYVQFGRVLDYPYAASFVAFDYLLEPPRTVDPSWINPWLPKGIGLLPALLAMLSPLAWLRGSREQRWWLAAIAVVTLGYVGLSVPLAGPIWRAFPVLQYLHFPWRFLTPAAVGVAALGGAGAWALRRRGRVALPLIAAGLTLGALGWLSPSHCALAHPPTLPGSLAFEQATGQLASTGFNELLPAPVLNVPNEPSIRDDLEAGREPTRLLPDSLPDGARILSAEYGPLDATIELESPVAFRARYLAFHYPGWRASIDDSPVALVPTSPEGLISFLVPPGRHSIQLRFTETPLRLVADAISVLSLVALVLLMVAPSRSAPDAEQPDRSGPPAHWVLLAVAILIVALKLAVIDGLETPLRRSNFVDGRLRRVDVPAEVTFGDEFVLLGYDALPEGVPSGDRFEVNTYWRVLQPGGPDYGVTVHVRDAEGRHWHGADVRPPRWHRTPPPTGEWPVDQYALIALSIPVEPGTPPGTYTVEVVAFDVDTLAPLTAHDAGGVALGPTLPLGQVVISAPRRPADPDALEVRRRLDVPLGPLTLLDAHFDRDEATAGESTLFSTVWRADEQPDEDLTLRLALLAADDAAAIEVDLPLAAAWHPTSAWQPGDIWRGQHLVLLPAHLASGTYTWRITLLPLQESSSLPSSIKIDAPSRTFSAPATDSLVGKTLGNQATLVGFELSSETLQPGDTLTVTLVWRAEAEASISYHVFLHLTGPDGDFAAQSDGVPASWTRPTTSWVAGEYVTDVHVLSLPADAQAGEYTLSAGLYTPGGGRLADPDGADAIRMATISLAR